MSNYKNVESEHQLRALVFDDYFKNKDVSWEQEIKNIDFIITENKSRKSGDAGAEKHYIWMETKKSVTDQYIMLVQLLLTIKKMYDKNEYIVPNYVGCFDTEKIIFVPMKLLQSILHGNDVKWNITPSNTKDEYFLKIINKLKYNLHGNSEFKIFKFGDDNEEIKDFITQNVYKGIAENKFEITEHNFDRVYLKWVEKVKPSIAINWKEEKKYGLLDGDFFLADLLSSGDLSIKERLLIVLQIDHYKLTKALKRGKKLIDDDKYFFKDRQKAYNEFWNIYKRPPLDKYWENIVSRKDLLVPQDIRERKGSFFTPQIWVELSQEYIADVFGEDWQENYYVWDCCAGTGNLLVGINKKIENVFASTIDESDVKAIHDRIDNGARLVKKNVFQFDFLNDDFKKLPKTLKDIIDDPEKRKRLIIYINPPYAETMSHGVKHKAGLNQTMVNIKYKNQLENCANRELFVQFLIRIYNEIPDCIIANFSTLKILQSPNFSNFRYYFKPKLKNLFLVPANTFDNVPGQFPIGFFIWDLTNKRTFKQIKADVYNKDGKYKEQKTIFCYDKLKLINEWIITTRNRTNEKNIGFMACLGNDFQQTRVNFIMNDKEQMSDPRGSWVTDKNLFEVSIYYAVRHCITPTWLNDRDQFLYPDDVWKKDQEFQNDCLTYTLFNNNIKSEYATNHWIPFTETEVNARDNFESHFMSDFIAGKIKVKKEKGLFDDDKINIKGKLKFSKEAKDAFNAGREVWKYYHSFPRVEVNASLYDIKVYFQGINKNGRMNNKSTDERYNELIDKLRDKLKILAKKIEPKVYEYGFLK